MIPAYNAGVRDKQNISFGTDKSSLNPHIAKRVDSDVNRVMEEEHQALTAGLDTDKLCREVDYMSLSTAGFEEILNKQSPVCTSADYRRKLAEDAFDEYEHNKWSDKYAAIVKKLQVYHHEDKDRSILEVAKFIGTRVPGFKPSRAQCKTYISPDGKWITKVTDRLFPGHVGILPWANGPTEFWIVDGRFSWDGQKVQSKKI